MVRVLAQEEVSGGGPEVGSPDKKRRGPLRWISLVSGWLALVAGVAGVGLHYNRLPVRTLVLAASFASYLMLGCVLATVLFALARQWKTAAAALVVTAGAVWTQLPMLWPDGSAPPGVDVAVMQSNLLFGLADADAVVQGVRDNRIEVLTLSELTPEILQRLQTAGIDAELPYHFTQPSGGGQGSGIFSRYPLRDEVKFDGFWLNNLRATMIHPDRGPVTVFSLHPVPPNIDFDSWQHELRTIRDLLAQPTGQVIVGGDFNATYDHSLYRDLLSDRYADSAELVGVGALPTFPNDHAWGPVIGIDRVLVAGGHATEVHSLSIPKSDHRAVVARLRL
ncbi:endonuclease/exonuclease/phosphatase family protein [Nocardia jejuensis]|uniref:endonuclease/exonuclease/phosphatase family protein n=1 Tax=Nocardia jejuensis TaxID=328049 RepID=UPI000A9FE6B7|nr:endonuclease/exonuclease/phosphatase family protein [Nocardia jejuensis]